MRCLVLSDIHGNLAALEAVLASAPPNLPVWCLGDVVGYGPSPNECIERLRSLDPRCIVGNHDWAVMNKVDVREFNPDAQLSVQWTQQCLDGDNLAYLESLCEKELQGEFTLVHGSPREPIWEYILEPLVAALNFHLSWASANSSHVPVTIGITTARWMSTMNSSKSSMPARSTWI